MNAFFTFLRGCSFFSAPTITMAVPRRGLPAFGAPSHAFSRKHVLSNMWNGAAGGLLELTPIGWG
jgi:hypothetical protein